jgi:fructan beta-fructosidase
VGTAEILIDKTVAEIFIDGGRRYIVKELPAATNVRGIELDMGRSGSIFNTLDVYKMASIWKHEARNSAPTR